MLSRLHVSIGQLPWRDVLAVAGASVLALASAYLGYRWTSAGATVPAVLPPTAVATRGSLVTTFIATGTTFAEVEARLSFTAATATGGAVRTVDVGLGEAVRAGQALVTLDARSAERAVEQARVGAEVARLALAQATLAVPASVAATSQTVAAASAAVQRAQNDVTTLRRGSYPDDLAAASQASLVAQNALTQTQRELAALEERARALVNAEAVQRQLDATNAQLSQAERDVPALLAVSDAATFVRPAVSDLTLAVDERCKDLGNRDRCAEVAAAANDLRALIDGLVARTQGPRDLASLAAALHRVAGSMHPADLEGPVFREVQALALRRGLQARHEALIFVVTPYGSPSADELLTAARARDAALAAANSAQGRLRRLTAGPTTEDLANATETVRAAQAALDAALAAQAALGEGGLATAAQQQQVLLADVGLRRAHDALEDTVLRAPFAGVVAAIAARIGDPATPGVPLVTITDPTALGLRLTVSESLATRIAPGQLGIARFDVLSERVYVIEVVGVGRVPTPASGAATYEARARVLPGDALRTRSSQLSAVLQLVGTPTGAETERDAAIQRISAQAPPIPGLTGTATLIDRVVEGAVLVPVAAVRTSSSRSVVAVRGSDGAVTQQGVVIGATDGTSFEVVSGLDEGDAVVLGDPASQAER